MSDYDAISAARATADEAVLSADITNLPPGYIEGFELSLADSIVSISAGSATVGGRQVTITENSDITDVDYVATRFASTVYYVYLTSLGEFKVDRIEPEYSTDYIYFAHPIFDWRAIGQIQTGGTGDAAYVIGVVDPDQTNYFPKDGNVGIGTTTPDQLLHVYSSIDTIVLIESGGAANVASLYITPTDTGASLIELGAVAGNGDTEIKHRGTGIFYIGTNEAADIRFRTSASTRMTIDSAGKTGIGVTAPAELLEVEDGNATTAIQISNTAADGDPYLAWALSGTKVFTMGVDDGDSDKLKIGTTAIGTNTRLTIDSSGNVGIGVADPDSKLEVNGTLKATDTSTFTKLNLGGGLTAFILNGVSLNAIIGATSQLDTDLQYIALQHSNTIVAGSRFMLSRSRGTLAAPLVVQDGDAIGAINFAGYDGTDYVIAGEIDLEADGTIAGNRIDGSLLFKTSNNSVLPITRMKISSDGKVGIGTSSPLTTLHIEHGAIGATPNSYGIRIKNTSSGNSWIVSSGLGTGLEGDFGIRSVTDGTYPLVIKATTGNVGIGTSIPNTLLEIKGVKTTGNIFTINTDEGGYVANDVLGKISFRNHDSSTGVNEKENAFIQFKATNTINGGASDAWNLEFGIADNASDGAVATTAMVITQDLYVGIGTSSPDTKLQVVGISRFGEDTTNYSEFESDGTLEFNGNATVWNDANVGGAILQLAAAGNPGKDEFKDDDGDDTGITTYAFAVGEYVCGSIEIPHDYKEGSNMVFHVHWQGIAAPTGVDNVRWQVTYTIGKELYELDDVTIDSAETEIDNQYAFYRTDVETIDGTNVDIGDQLLFQIQRIASVGDAYAGEALIATVGIHYECDTVGSRSITTK